MFLPGTASAAGDGSCVSESVPLRQLSAGLAAHSQGPVPGYGPVGDDHRRGEWIFFRDARTCQCLTAQDEMTEKYHKVSVPHWASLSQH